MKRNLHTAGRRRRSSIRATAVLLAVLIGLGGVTAGVPVDALAAETASDPSEEKTTTMLLASAGFSYAFSAKKVSLRDVEDRMYSEGVILAKRTESENGLVLSASAAEASEETMELSDASEESAVDAVMETDTGEEEVSDTSDGPEESSEPVSGTDDENGGDSADEAGEDSAGETADTAAVEVTTEETADAAAGEAGEDARESDGADTASDSIAAETQEEDRAIEETTLTPVQKKEQSVVEAVSETQNIEIDSATATILAATAVSVVSDTETSVALAEMLDRKQMQAKLDQGVISAVEAEALMAASSWSSSGTSSEGTGDVASAGEETSGGTELQEESGTASETEDDTIATDADGNEIIVAQVDDYINIREDASEDAEIVGKLYNGSVATVLGRTGNGWVRIQSGDVYGYIREEYVATGSTAAELAESVATKQAVVTTETLRVRAAAQADSDVISLIAGGETLDIIEEVDGWYKVNTVDGEGYISADFADVEEVYPTAVWLEDEETEEESADDDTQSATSSGSSSSSSSGSSSVSSLNTYTGSVSTSSASGSQVVAYALQFVGNPYVWGGTSLTNGADCSGFTMAVYAAFGVSLPHSSYSQEYCGTAVASLDEAQPGDLIIYSGHVAIYMGNNQIVHASNPANGICTGTATYRTIVAIRRIFN